MGAMMIERYLRGSSEEIESRASKWSDSWLENTPAVVEQEEEVKPATPSEATAHNTPSSRNSDSPLNSEQEKAIILTPTLATFNRNGINKG